jgi:hypothetical protein
MRHYTSVKQWERGRRKVNYTDEEIEALRPIVRRFFGRRSPAEDYDFFLEAVGHRRQSVWYDAAEMLILLCDEVPACLERLRAELAKLSATLQYRLATATFFLGDTAAGEVVILGAIDSRHKRPAQRGCERAQKFNLRQALPAMERAVRACKDAKARAAMEHDRQLLDKGYTVEDSGSRGEKTVCIRTEDGGLTWIDVSAARLKKIGVARFVADYRAGKID